MNVIDPYEVTSANMTSNVTEDDHAEYDAGTTYAAGDRVIVIGSVHKVYQSVVDSNVGNAPSNTIASTAFWVYVGATNLVKAFDEQTSDPVTRLTPITYSFTPDLYVSALSFFKVSMAASAVITVTNIDEIEVYSETFSLVDTSHMTDWFKVFTEVPRSVRQKVIENLPFAPGGQIDLEFIGPTGQEISVGQIAFGKAERIGTTLAGTAPGYRSYSRKERDFSGNSIVTPRPPKRTVQYAAAVDTQQVDNIIEYLSSLEAKGAVYFADSDTDFLGTTIYGLMGEFEIPESINVSFLNAEVQSL
jgi:hypothetical protein